MDIDQQLEFNGTLRFRIRRRLGAGGMGVVYDAYDEERKTRVALKTLRHVDANSLYRFKSEFRAIQDISHRNLVRLGELFCEDGVWFFTMEYIEGVDLMTHVRREYHKKRGPAASPDADADAEIGYDEQRLRSVAAQLARGITAIHDAGKIHRDIKPGNVLVDNQGRAVLLDFGLVTEVLNDESSASVVGTPTYMAPEQALGRSAGPAADWYSFGAILYEALTGHVPHTGGSPVEILMKKQRFEPAPPRGRVPGVPADLDALCVEMLQLSPDRRPNGAAILERLGADANRTPEFARHSISTIGELVPFVGRVKELAELTTAYQNSLTGSAVTMFVTGESGIGKSELVHQFTRRAEDEDDTVVVLHGRCYERENVPYKAFDGLIDQLGLYMSRLDDVQAASLLPLRASLLPELFPVLQRVGAIAGAPRDAEMSPDPQRRRTRMFEALRELLARLAARNRLILVIDDFQWADADSLMLLDQLMHPPEEPKLLLLITSRSEGGVPGLDRLKGDVRQLELGALPEDDGKQLVKLLSSRLRSNAELQEAIAREAAGHPLFIRELALNANEIGLPAEAIGRLDEALWSRINQLDGPARDLIEVLSVAGTPIRQQIAAGACGQEYADYERMASMLRVGFLARTAGSRRTDTVETYHDRVRDAVLSRLAPEKARELHRLLARALETAGAAAENPQALVRHFEAAEEKTRAAMHAEEAAQRASRASAFERAVEFYRTALRLGDYTDERRRKLRYRLAEALMNAGRGPKAAAIFQEISEVADPALRLECRRLAAEQLLISGHIEAGMAACDALLDEIGTRPSKTPRGTLINLIWYRLQLALRGTRWQKRHESQVPREDLIKLDVYKAVAHGLAMVDNVRGAEFNSRYLLLALKTGEAVRLGKALGTEIVFQASQGGRGLKNAARLHGQLLELLKSVDSPIVDLWASLSGALIGYFQGRFRETADVMAKADQQFNNLAGSRYERNNGRLFRIFSLKHSGYWKECRAITEPFNRDAAQRGDRYQESTTKRFTAFLFLARDDVPGALEYLDSATWTPPIGKFHLQHWFELEGRAEIALYSGEAAQALIDLADHLKRCERSLLLRVAINRTHFYWAHAKLMLGGLSREPNKRAKALKSVSRIAKRLSREGQAQPEVFGLLLSSAVSVQMGQFDKAIEGLLRAVDLADRNDLRSLEAAARRRHGELLGSEAGAEEIARSEAFFSSQEILDPCRICNVFAPGFNRR